MHDGFGRGDAAKRETVREETTSDKSARVERGGARRGRGARGGSTTTAARVVAGRVGVLAGSAAHAEAHAYGVAHEHARKGEDEEMCERADGRAGVVETVSERKSLWSRVKSALGEESTREGKLAAYAVGVVHGASGVSGVIYILPAVFLDDATRIALYLFGFCLTSVLVMTTRR